ncbi:DUF3822 family protein [Robertkochia sp. 1368]|nr:DUF3822 family protein [Robertkochia sediminum]
MSIQVSLSGLSFSIRDAAEDRVIRLDHRYFEKPSNAEKLVEALDDLLKQEGLGRSNFKDVRVIHDNELSALVPKALFNESNLSDYLKYNVKLFETDFISFDELKGHEMFNVYVPFTNVNNYIFDRFGAFEYKHASTILLETLLNQAGRSEVKNVYVQVGRNNFEVVVIDDQKLLLYNRFPYQTREDFIYYVLFVYEQLGLNREKDPLHLLGAINEDDSLYKMAYTYIKEIALGKNHHRQNIAKGLPNIPDHQDLTLLNSF